MSHHTPSHPPHSNHSHHLHTHGEGDDEFEDANNEWVINGEEEEEEKVNTQNQTTPTNPTTHSHHALTDTHAASAAAIAASHTHSHGTSSSTSTSKTGCDYCASIKAHGREKKAEQRELKRRAKREQQQQQPRVGYRPDEKSDDEYETDSQEEEEEDEQDKLVLPGQRIAEPVSKTIITIFTAGVVCIALNLLRKIVTQKLNRSVSADIVINPHMILTKGCRDRSILRAAALTKVRLLLAGRSEYLYNRPAGW